MKTLSIVVPVYQNEANLGETVPRLLDLRDRIGNLRLELVFVEDGSTDHSYEILCEQARRHPGIIRVVKLTRNFGQTPAIQAGLKHATGDCVGIISADLQEPCDLFVEMVQAWERGSKFVIGERQARSDGHIHPLVSGIYWKLIRRFAFADFPQLGYDFCLLDRQVVDDINRINEKNSSIFVLLYWFGYRPECLGITRKARDKGHSQWRLSRKIRFTVDTLIGFTYLPARLIVFSGFAAATAALGYLAFVMWVWARSHAAPPGWMTLASVGLLGGSLILFALGIIAEYLVRILDETRKRPPFVVEHVVRPDAERAASRG